MIEAFGTCQQCGGEYQKKIVKFPMIKAMPLIRPQKYCGQKCREAAQRRLTKAKKERVRKYREENDDHA
jgi:hypothetical protein